MKTFCLRLLIGLPVCFSAFTVQAAGPAAASGGTLREFFASHGFGGAPLERRMSNHLFVSAIINSKRTGLLVDTGCPVTLIDKSSAATLGLSVKGTNAPTAGVFGRRWERYGVSKLQSVAMGNCTITNVPVALADESDLNSYTRLPHIDGLLGAREMLKFGMVIDCARQEVYISPAGPNAATSQQLAGLLAGRGFSRIPMRQTSNSHFDVPASINGHATRLIVDTGAITTLLAKEFAVQSGVAPGSFGAGRVTSSGVGLSSGYVKELQIGDFKIANTEVVLAPIDSAVLQSKKAGEANAGLLGEEYLSLNFAIIDMGGMALYLRHAD